MAWEPIELTEQDVQNFAGKLERLADGLDGGGKEMLRELITRAGGAGDPGSATVGDLRSLTAMLRGVWEAGTTIAPLYSGAMPRTGGGTVD